MGDRGNIIIESGGHTFPNPVYFYTHWSGSRIPQLLSLALKAGKDRWDDPSYLARVIFQTLLQGDEDITGFGISTAMGDGGTEYYVNMEKKTVRSKTGLICTFQEFVDSPVSEDQEEEY